MLIVRGSGSDIKSGGSEVRSGGVLEYGGAGKWQIKEWVKGVVGKKGRGKLDDTGKRGLWPDGDASDGRFGEWQRRGLFDRVAQSPSTKTKKGISCNIRLRGHLRATEARRAFSL